MVEAYFVKEYNGNHLNARKDRYGTSLFVDNDTRKTAQPALDNIVNDSLSKDLHHSGASQHTVIAMEAAVSDRGSVLGKGRDEGR